MYEAAYCREHSDLLKNYKTRQSKEVVGELMKRRQQDPKENIDPEESWKQLVKDIMKCAPEVDTVSNGIVIGITKVKEAVLLNELEKSQRRLFFTVNLLLSMHITTGEVKKAFLKGFLKYKIGKDFPFALTFTQ